MTEIKKDNAETRNEPMAFKGKRTKGLYSIYDYQRRGFLSIIEKQNDTMAERDFKIMCNSENSLMKMCPDDFSLWKLGEYDEENGTLIADKKELLKAKEIINE